MLGSFSVLSQFKVMLNRTAPLLQKPVIGIHLIVGSLLYVLYVMMIAYVSDNDELIILPWMSDIKYPFFL
jgi:glycerol-3-phosphate dehydrogenase